MECRFIWTPRSSKVATLSAAAMRRAAVAHLLLGHAALRRVIRRRRATSKCGSTCSRPSACSREPVARDQVLLHEHGEHRREQQRVAAGLHLEVDVGDLGGLGAARIDHDQAALRVLRDLAQGHAGARDAVREPRVLAEEQRDLAVLEVAARVAAEHLRRDPELAGLLLRERARADSTDPSSARVARAVRAGQVVALSAAAVVEDRLAAVRVADRREARGDLADRGVPVDLLEAAVGATAQRLRQAVRAVLVVVEARGLLARVAAARPDARRRRAP